MATANQLLEVLLKEIPRCENYAVVVRPGISTLDGEPNRDADPVAELCCDHDGKEILLVVASRSPKSRSQKSAMTVGFLVTRLQALKRDCGTYCVEATCSKPDPSDLIRCDFPIHWGTFSHDTEVCSLIWHYAEP